MATFDGDNLVITLDATGGVGIVDAQQDLYEPWKVFVRGTTARRRDARFPPAFTTEAGNLLVPGLNIGAYFFLRNDLGWRMRPAEEDATIGFTGNLIATDTALPLIVPTLGGFTVLINGLQPITQAIPEIRTDVKLVKAMTAGNATVTGTGPFVVTVFDEDNVTVLATFDLSADGKNRTRTS